MHIDPASPNCTETLPFPADAPLDPEAALVLANRAARSALRRKAALDSDAAHDVAADALLVLLRRTIPFRRPSVLAAVKHVARKRTRGACRRTSLESDIPEPIPADEPEPAAGGPASRTFRDGSTARLDGEPCEANMEALTLEAPDGSITLGREALRRAQRLLLEERCRAVAPDPLRAHNARRAVAALERDALLLSVSGLPWRAALDQLAAAGVVVTREGLRSGQRAARLRCMGLAAHDRARR